MWSIGTLHTEVGRKTNENKMLTKSAKVTNIYLSATILLLIYLNILTTTNGLPIEQNDSAVSATGHFESFEGFDEPQEHGYDEEFHSEQLGDYHESFGHEHEQEHDFGSNHLDFHGDFDEKPVPGIDHGKGAFSYSSTYEFKDADQHKQDFEHSF